MMTAQILRTWADHDGHTALDCVTSNGDPITIWANDLSHNGETWLRAYDAVYVGRESGIATTITIPAGGPHNPGRYPGMLHDPALAALIRAWLDRSWRTERH